MIQEHKSIIEVPGPDPFGIARNVGVKADPPKEYVVTERRFGEKKSREVRRFKSISTPTIHDIGMPSFLGSRSCQEVR